MNADDTANQGPDVPWYLKGAGSSPAVPPPALPPSAPPLPAPKPPALKQFTAPSAVDPTPVDPTPVQRPEPPRSEPSTQQHVPQDVEPSPTGSYVAPAPAPAPVRNRTTQLALVLAAVIVIAGGTTYALSSSGDSAAASGTTTPVPASQPADVGRTTSAPRTSQATVTTSASPTPTVDPEAAALASLDQLRRSSLAGLRLDNRWVAQVASKSVGITDRLQIAANGTNRFYAADIFAEVHSMQSLLSGTPMLILQSIDFGKYSVDGLGQPYWVTIADPGFADADAVHLWCARTFPSLSAVELANACAPRTLGPAHP